MTIEFGKTKFQLELSFFAVVAIMLLTAESETVTVCLVSSLLHECGHLIFMFAFGEKPNRVVFGAFGIRIEKNEVTSLSYQKEAVVAAAGVIVNALLAGIFFPFYLINQSKTAFTGTFVNLFIAALNMVPVGMLDAGNFLRCILLIKFDESKTERLLSKVSNVAVCLLCSVCLIYMTFVSFNISIIIVCVYLVIINYRFNY